MCINRYRAGDRCSGRLVEEATEKRCRVEVKKAEMRTHSRAEFREEVSERPGSVRSVRPAKGVWRREAKRDNDGKKSGCLRLRGGGVTQHVAREGEAEKGDERRVRGDVEQQ